MESVEIFFFPYRYLFVLEIIKPCLLRECTVGVLVQRKVLALPNQPSLFIVHTRFSDGLKLDKFLRKFAGVLKFFTSNA